MAHKDTPYWWEAAPPLSAEKSSVEPNCDVAIVGAGYAGLCAALHLARAGRKVQVFEREQLGYGASSRNGGFTSGNIRPDDKTLIRKFGLERAVKIAAEGHEARRFMIDFLADEGIDADFQLVGRFSGAMTRAEYDVMARSSEAIQRATGIESYAVPLNEVRQHIATDLYAGGSVRMDIGGLHPAKFHAELVRLALAEGVSIHSECRVETIDNKTVITERGRTQAREVLVCTNGYTDHSDRWLRQRLVPLRSRIIATEDLGEERVRELVPGLKMLTDTRAMTYYFRPSPDGRRILFGGRDVTNRGDPHSATHRNYTEMCRIFPQLEGVGISHSWFGYVAMNRDMVPRIFRRGAVHYATGFCGSGVVWAPWLGLKVAQKILGVPNSESSFDFRPPRFVPTWRGNAWFMPLVFADLERKDRKVEALASAERASRNGSGSHGGRK
ncbi:FAD-binding oxidoreductase [Ochrobactrum vermis]|uniref:FAD-binding oxidoreductase n=1 Tax=Ochrobactrum vermis TaxID=1827297 RepID=A0ABU8PMM5_9HYPH|nr:FAD-binding oxidoreductase [Ochrobactrum vermis]PQZ26926.1 oxidoreductase [Ochrobactrum vermis]